MMKFTIDLFPFEAVKSNFTSANVMIYFSNGQTYFGSIYTLEQIKQIKKNSAEDGEFLNGKYFWASHFIIADEISESNICEIIEDMLERDCFYNAFFPANKEAFSQLMKNVG